MSDKENPSSGVADRVSPVVVVESVSSKRSVPFKPAELQDKGAPDLHQKRAPAVTTAVSENLKESTLISDAKEPQKGSEYGTSSDRHMHVAKKLSSNISNDKRDTTPAVTIPMAPIELESKQSVIVTAPPKSTIVTPIPETDTQKDVLEDKADLDSITSDITELRTPEIVRRSSEWNEKAAPNETFKEDIEVAVPLQRKMGNELLNASFIEDKDVPIVEPSTSLEFKKKEISWSDETYLEKVPLQDISARSATWMLERKASVGPCYRRGMPCAGPSGITICLPKKSSKNVNITTNDCAPVKSGISITMSKRCLDNKPSNFEPFLFEMGRNTVRSPLNMENDSLKSKQDSYSNYCGNIRDKLDNLYGRIRSAFHI